MISRPDLKQKLSDVRGAALLFIKDIGNGLLVVSHNTLALVGLAVVGLGIAFGSQASLRDRVETATLGWLHARQEARAEADGNTLLALAEPEAVSRATATDLQELTPQQASVAKWLSRRYQVAPEPLARLVQEAWGVGQRAKVEPTLILAVMAIESRFNPFAQSAVGAQGLMQVMTKVHDEKYEVFGGSHAAFDPVTNLRVGVQVLRECIQRAGSIEEGLKYYVGAANLADDAGYVGRVLAEHDLLKAVATGKSVPPSATPVARPLREASAPQEGSAQIALLQPAS
jgi:hypothetical protein